MIQNEATTRNKCKTCRRWNDSLFKNIILDSIHLPYLVKRLSSENWLSLRLPVNWMRGM